MSRCTVHGSGDTGAPAVYLSRHLPDAVDELQEDGRAIGVRVVLVPVADSLKQQDREHESHRASWRLLSVT